jgi:hypothetical protein
VGGVNRREWGTEEEKTEVGENALPTRTRLYVGYLCSSVVYKLLKYTFSSLQSDSTRSTVQPPFL